MPSCVISEGSLDPAPWGEARVLVLANDTPLVGSRRQVGRTRRLKLRPLFGTLCEVLVIVRDLKCHLLGYFVLHIIGKTARFVGAFAPVLRVVNKGGRHKVLLTRPPQVARTSPPRFHPINQTDHYPT